MSKWEHVDLRQDNELGDLIDNACLGNPREYDDFTWTEKTDAIYFGVEDPIQSVCLDLFNDLVNSWIPGNMR